MRNQWNIFINRIRIISNNDWISAGHLLTQIGHGSIQHHHYHVLKKIPSNAFRAAMKNVNPLHRQYTIHLGIPYYWAVDSSVYPVKKYIEHCNQCLCEKKKQILLFFNPFLDTNSRNHGNTCWIVHCLDHYCSYYMNHLGFVHYYPLDFQLQRQCFGYTLQSTIKFVCSIKYLIDILNKLTACHTIARVQNLTGA